MSSINRPASENRGASALPRITTFFIAAFPFFLSVVWFSLNRRYPCNDAGYFFQSAMRAFVVWKTDGLWPSLIEVYLRREFKPVLHAAFAWPVLLLTGGNVRFSVAFVNLSLLAAFLYFQYKLFRIFFSKLPSSFMTCFIGTLPWVLRASFYFQAELPVLAASTACVYFLFRSDYFSVKKYSIGLGISLGMALCFQPAIVVLSIGAMLLVHCLMALKRGKISLTDLAMSLPPVAMIVLTAWMQIKHPDHQTMINALFCASAAAWLAFWRIQTRRWRLSDNYFFMLTVSVFIFSIWMLPRLSDLFQWSFISAFSDLAAHDGKLSGGAISKSLFLAYGNFALIPFIAMAIAAVGISWKKGTDLSKLLFTLVPLIIAPPIIGAFSYTGDPRFHLTSFTMLYVLGVIASYKSEGTFVARLMRVLTPLIGVFNLTILGIILIFNEQPLINAHYKPLGQNFYIPLYWGLPLNRSVNPASSAVDELLALINPKTPDLIHVAVRYPFNKNEFNLISMEKGLPLRFDDLVGGYWQRRESGEPDAELFIRKVRQEFDFIEIGPLDGNVEQDGPQWLNVPWEKDGTRLIGEIIERWRSNDLSRFGLIPISTFKPKESDWDYALLKVDAGR